MNIDKILKEHEGYIKGVTYNWCNKVGIHNKQDREDCLQEVYIKICDNMDKYDDLKNNNILPFLAMLIKSRVIDYKKVLSRNVINTIENIEEISDEYTDMDYTMQLMDSINELEKDELDLYDMYFKQGYTQQEIAKIKGCSRQLITKNISIILNKLKVEK